MKKNHKMKIQTKTGNRLIDRREADAIKRYKEGSLSPTATWVAITVMLVLGMLADSIWAAI